VAAAIAFAAFGAYWGVWGASVPRVQDQAGVTDGQLGIALLFVGAGALPAMLLVGRALDRWGPRVAAAVIVALGAVGAALSLTAHDLVTLSVGLAVVGATSGAADVAINAVAGRAETLAGRPVITRCHGVFSTLVVVSTLTTGLAAAAHLPLSVPFLAATALSVLAGAAMVRALPRHATTAAPAHPSHDPLAPPAITTLPTPGGVGSVSRRRVWGLAALGVLGALAFASENAHQSWAAVFASDELGAGAGLAAVAPAVFAGTVAVTRFGLGGLGAGRARLVLLGGSVAAAGGALVIAAAPGLVVAAVGLVVAGAGTAVLFPTIVGMVSRTVAESYRGRATSIVTTVSYLGFLLGPVYVGAWADALGLRGAMVAVALLGAALFLLAPVLLRVAGGTRGASRTGGPL
jgi:MFS family permease